MEARIKERQALRLSLASANHLGLHRMFSNLVWVNRSEGLICLFKIYLKTHLPCVLVLFTIHGVVLLRTENWYQKPSWRAWTASAMATSLCSSPGKWHIHICHRRKHHACIWITQGTSWFTELITVWGGHSVELGSLSSRLIPDPSTENRVRSQ